MIRAGHYVDIFTYILVMIKGLDALSGHSNVGKVASPENACIPN